ncbi:MAG: hypothetical protein CMJ48_11945 [Planctomycetaceae bacterium]|nr:hypothetical protein [Planctomycetaceae bacterium]
MTDPKLNRRAFVQGTAAGALAGLQPALGAVAASAPNAAGDANSNTPFGPPVWPPYEKIEAVLQHWAERHGGVMALERLGLSRAGRNVHAVHLTDTDVEGADKEHVLLTALHAGLERSAATTVMTIIEWLLSGDPEAQEILRRQVVVCLPVPDPDRYEAGEVSPLYGNWNAKGPLNPGEVPEAVYVQQVMDRMQPELHADIHGTNLDFERYIMFECSGTSYSNPALRPYHREIIQEMDEAALTEGFPSDRAESDAERVYQGPGLAGMAERCWIGQPRFYGAIYAYYHFHTLVAATEVAWERSGLLRHQRLFEIGNEVRAGEYYPGYPTRAILGNTHARLTAYGQTAKQRRASRVELWNRMSEFRFAAVDPAVEGKALCVLSTSASADANYLTEPTLAAVAERLQKHPQMDGAKITQFMAGWPAGQNHPQAWFPLQRRSAAPQSKPHKPIEHGACLRLRIPYDKAEITDLRLNGHPVKPSPVDGCVSWKSQGSTYIEVNLTPKRLKEEDLFVLTCDYDPRERRRHWETWRTVGDE